jgi:hypothetical protein
MIATGQCGTGLVRMPASICLQGNQRPRSILTHETKTGAKVVYLPPTCYHFLIREKAQKGWLLLMRIFP